MAGESKKIKADPFKVKKSKSSSPQESDTVTPPEDVREAIDAFRECQEQAKHFEGEATVHKDKIMDYSRREFSKRSLNGHDTSFKMLGDESMVTYVVMNSSAGLTEEDVANFAAKWGDEAADELIERDYRSIRFDPKVLEANYEAVVDALQTLPESILEQLFKPMLLKASDNALNKAKKYIKDKDSLAEITQDLKLKHYVR